MVKVQDGKGGFNTVKKALMLAFFGAIFGLPPLF
jgi:hypothetical protein